MSNTIHNIFNYQIAKKARPDIIKLLAYIEEMQKKLAPLKHYSTSVCILNVLHDAQLELVSKLRFYDKILSTKGEIK